MGTLKVIRTLVGLGWIGITIWGLAALFQGQWVALIVAVVVWFVCGMIFSSLHNSLQRVEASHVSQQMQAIGSHVAMGDWAGALAQSSRAVQILTSSRNRDSGANMAGPLAMVQLNHGVLLGANGRSQEGLAMIDAATSTLRRVSASSPQFADVLGLATAVSNELSGWGGTPSAGQFKRVAEELNEQL